MAPPPNDGHVTWRRPVQFFNSLLKTNSGCLAEKLRRRVSVGTKGRNIAFIVYNQWITFQWKRLFVPSTNDWKSGPLILTWIFGSIEMELLLQQQSLALTPGVWNRYCSPDSQPWTQILVSSHVVALFNLRLSAHNKYAAVSIRRSFHDWIQRKSSFESAEKCSLEPDCDGSLNSCFYFIKPNDKWKRDNYLLIRHKEQNTETLLSRVKESFYSRR